MSLSGWGNDATSPRAATVALSAAASGFGWQGGGGCSADAASAESNSAERTTRLGWLGMKTPVEGFSSHYSEELQSLRVEGPMAGILIASEAKLFRVCGVLPGKGCLVGGRTTHARLRRRGSARVRASV